MKGVFHMAKKGNGFGKLVAFATIAGAVAAGISYFTKYKSFHTELEEDFPFRSSSISKSSSYNDIFGISVVC